jgi:hypothetical protein
VELALQAAMPWRRRLKARLEMPLIQGSLTAPILINAVIPALESWKGKIAVTRPRKSIVLDRH